MKNRGKMPQQKGLYSPLGKYDAHFRRELPGEVDFADHATEPATLPNNEAYRTKSVSVSGASTQVDAPFPCV